MAVIIPSNPCYIGATMVFTQTDGQEVYTEVRAIKPGQHKVYSVSQARWVDVMENLQGWTSTKFIRIDPGTIPGEDQIDSLFITRGHPIRFNGKETAPQDIPGAFRVTLDPAEPLFSLCTMHREYINICGIPVLTWSWFAWTNMQDTLNKREGSDRAFSILLPEADSADGTIMFEVDSCGTGNPKTPLVLAWNQPVIFSNGSHQRRIPARDLVNGRQIKVLRPVLSDV